MKSHEHSEAVAVEYCFRKHDSIGSPMAEADDKFLEQCFVDNGDLACLRNCQDNRGIVIGRTGAGKTALLKMLRSAQDRAIALNPHDLALEYISGSPAIQFCESVNLRMDLYYRFLWRHVCVVEILKRHLQGDNGEIVQNWRERLKLRLQGKRAYIDALDYLDQWGEQFWNNTDVQLKELTRRVERELKGIVGVDIQPLIKLGAEGGRRLTEEQRFEIVQRGQEVIYTDQMRKLNALFNALNEKILDDDQKRYFVVVDQLDEQWADDSLRYRLIRALIETMKEFNEKMKHAKVVIALRTDLFDQLLEITTDSFFQGEKYRGLCLPIKWKPDALEILLDQRVNELIRHKYTGRQVTHQDILPSVVGPGREQSLNFILNRTLLRPRDIIAFLNMCIEEAEGQTTIDAHHILRAESRYSVERLKSICDEWSVHYPYLNWLCGLLKKRSYSFKLRDLSKAEIDELCLSVLSIAERKTGEDVRQLQAYFDGNISADTLRGFIAHSLHRVGVVGLKTESFRAVSFSYGGEAGIAQADINDQTVLEVHPMFRRALGIGQ